MLSIRHVAPNGNPHLAIGMTVEVTHGDHWRGGGAAGCRGGGRCGNSGGNSRRRRRAEAKAVQRIGHGDQRVEDLRHLGRVATHQEAAVVDPKQRGGRYVGVEHGYQSVSSCTREKLSRKN